MTTREKFKRRVIEIIHGLPYEEAIKKEEKNPDCLIKFFFDQDYGIVVENTIRIGSVMYGYKDEKYIIIGLPITIGRVIGAFQRCGLYPKLYDNEICIEDNYIYRKLTNTDGSECTDDSQTDETISKLYEFIK